VSAWPAVVGALVAKMRALPAFADVEVYDGPPVTDDRPLAYATVGYVAGDTDAGTWARSRRNDFRVEEVGTVRCQLVAQTGDTDLPAVRAQLFALIDALDALLRADQRLGVLSADGTCEMAADVLSVMDQQGTAQAAVVTFTYTSRS